MSAEKTSDNRKRNWVFEFYPESCPDDWRDIISSWNVPCGVILHDSDINEDGSLVKPHYQGGLFFDGKKSLKQIQDLISPLGCRNCKPMESPEGYVRYLVHLDDPDKHQYSVDDIFCFSGFNPCKYIDDSVDPDEARDLILSHILSCNVTEFAVLASWCLDNDLTKYLASRAAYFHYIVDSMRHSTELR